MVICSFASAEGQNLSKTRKGKKRIKKIGVLGHFGFGKNLLNGQTIKTKIMTEALEKKYGSEQVEKVDTHGRIKFLMFLPFQIFALLKKCKNVIIFPAHNGVRIISPVLLFTNRFFHRTLHYCVIGGWLPKMCEDNPSLAKKLKRFNYIYVETSTLKHKLENQGFDNVTVIPNCKELTVLSKEDLVCESEKPLKLCIFSRVTKEKGIEDAVNVVKRINEEKGETVYSLDIYGQIDGGQNEWFESIKSQFPKYIKYCGAVEFIKSVETLKNYYLLLFPTRFFTEGIPGTIIDGYSAGIPVVSARWESAYDMIDEGKTGYTYSFGNVEEFYNTLKACENIENVKEIKENCLEKANEFRSDGNIEKIMLG